MCIVRAIENAFKIKEERGWDRIYVAVDLHGTVLKPNYKSGNIAKEFYPMAIETLQEMTERKDIILIISTCSWPEEIFEYEEYFKTFNIKFDYINENPEVESEVYGHGYFEDKYYFNVLLEDKSGFLGDTEWPDVYKAITKNKLNK
jgi:methionine salvage enolase-phosphatase E1